jgi:23S rRNA U2552 (ribose-2'-O)-methylase RlmE/FtsJ
MKLFDIFKTNNDRPIAKWLNYFEIYERYLEKYRNKSINFLEIGVQGGGSLQMWKKYFGANSKIVGIDIDPNTKFEEEQISVEIGNQSDEEFLKKVVEEYGPFDIIIDDGSHIQSDVLNSFFFLYPTLNRGGTYIIEDTHTAYFKLFQGGLKSDANSVSIFSKFVHDMNAEYVDEPFVPQLKDLSSMSFYNSMVIFEKQTAKDRYAMNISKDKTSVTSTKQFFESIR